MKKTNIDNLFTIFTKETPGCAVCVIQNGTIILERCFGLADLKNKVSIKPNTAFRLASLTKPFTAMAIMMLKEKKLIRYGDSLEKFFPDFPTYGKDVTIRQLLTHTSGMPDHEKPLYKKIKRREEPTIYDSLEILGKQKTALFRPGNRYLYSDAGFVILALIIEKITGRRYADYLKQTIFSRLGLNNTLVADETKPKIKNRAYGYKKVRRRYEVFDYDPLNYIVGNEGIYSAIRDLAKWQRAWETDILVSYSTLREALINGTTVAGKSKCGFSWFIQKKNNKNIIFQDGFWVGFNNIMLTDFNTKTTVILLSNTNNFPGESKKINFALEILNKVTNN